MPVAGNPAHQHDREEMAAFLMRLRGETQMHARLVQAVEAVPRRPFVRPAGVAAYGDRSLPLDCGETMPGAFFAVSLVHTLSVEAGNRVLEVGTGSGYVTALLAKLASRVTSLERYKRLLKAADERLKACGVANVTLVQEDGREGYRDAAPFDRIILHAAFEALPRTFLEQLAPHGQLLCAIGPAVGAQRLVRFHKVGSRLEQEDLQLVRYQPLARGIAAVL